MKLTSAHLKFLLIKGLHLLTVIGILFLLVVYCHHNEKKTAEKENVVDTVNEDASLSAYQQFCENNEDVNCGAVENFVSEEAPSSQVVLMDTDEFENDWKEKVSEVAASGTNTEVQPRNMTELLEQLYEENLPEDIIDEIISTQHHETPKLNFLPKHKPPYFGKKPVIVVVIDDMGISKKHTAEITSLHYPLTTAYLTYGQQLIEQIENSLNAGHEIILHTPMEPQTKADLAPDTLTTAMKIDEIKKNLTTMLSNFPLVKGINNHMGSKLTEDFERMKAVMEVLKEKEMFFLDSKTSAKSRAEEAAQEVGVPHAHRHVFLDNTNEKGYILGQLQKLESLSRKNGYAIAIGHPKSGTFEALKEWLPKLEKKGFKLMFLSDVVKILNS